MYRTTVLTEGNTKFIGVDQRTKTKIKTRQIKKSFKLISYLISDSFQKDRLSKFLVYSYILLLMVKPQLISVIFFFNANVRRYEEQLNYDN